ncbi:hypothetical protein EU527_09980 [Candidatus Thorarchaeota archaeon]|nr:MAG: hypothetical protein EU527_09980 [Candidatus Thorarchaeota archaeon]
MKTIGYFEGTDSSLLSKIVAEGFCTVPLANEWDGHGKIASHIEPGEIHLIISHLHKLLPPRGKQKDTKEVPVTVSIDAYRGSRPIDLLYPAKTYNIPVLVVVPKEYYEKAKDLLEDANEFVTLIDPDELEEKVRAILKF